MRHLILLSALAYLSWPYINLYQLGNALAKNDQVEMTKWIDLYSIRNIYKENLQWQVKQTVGNPRNFPEFLRGGAEMLGDAAIDSMITTDWLRKQLNNGYFHHNLSFAFFESPTRFMMRIGELGHDPIHIQMNLQDWKWRVTAVYE